MECREVRQLAEAFVSEQLLVETTQAVVAHLERCPACRAEIEGLRRLRAATRSAITRSPDLTIRPEFRAALTARLQQEAIRRKPPPRMTRTWLAIAASLLLIAGVGLGLRGWSALSFSDLLRAAVGDHQNCALTFALAEPPIRLAEAARRYGGIYQRLETVEPASATLSGGPIQIVERHSCVYHGRRFAHIVLRYKEQAVSLLVTEDQRRGGLLWSGGASTDASIDPMIAELPATGSFHVSSFRSPRHVVFVVSSLPGSDVQEVAQAMVASVAQALTDV
jgi:hypothetical protein